MDQERLVLSLPGLKRASCVPEIETAVRSLDGVIWAILNFAAEEIVIIYDPATLGISTLVDAVQRIGLDPSLKAVHVKRSLKQPCEDVHTIAPPSTSGRKASRMTWWAAHRGWMSRVPLVHHR
jgi:copper chaperone CopZ